MKNIVFLLIITIAISCHKDKCHVITVFDVIENAKMVDINEFSGVFIEARNKINCKYISYHYTINYNGINYKLPNFKYIKEDMYKNFDIKGYLKVTNDSFDSLKKKSNNIFKTFEVLNAIKIWHVDNATIFEIDNKKQLLYCTNVYLIKNEYWQKFINKSKNKDDWYWLE